MTQSDTTAAFAAFHEAVIDDPRLAASLRGLESREAFVAQAIALGAERGFAFDDAAARAALRQGEERWLMLGAEVA